MNLGGIEGMPELGYGKILFDILEPEWSQEMDKFYLKLISEERKMRGNDINIDITRKCTLKCRHCYNHSGEMNNDELTSDELFRIMNDLASTRPDNFCICGGEPLLKKK